MKMVYKMSLVLLLVLMLGACVEDETVGLKGEKRFLLPGTVVFDIEYLEDVKQLVEYQKAEDSEANLSDIRSIREYGTEVGMGQYVEILETSESTTICKVIPAKYDEGADYGTLTEGVYYTPCNSFVPLKPRN